jgi:hypothetical protein
MAAAARAGVNVLGILTYSPPWASSDPSGQGGKSWPPQDAGDYARFAAAVTGRYGAEGTFWALRPDLPRSPLKAVELWNEPYIHHSWAPNPDPPAYGALATGAARAIRAVAPDVKILVPGDVHQHRTDFLVRPWLDTLLASAPELPSLIDGYSVHPYPGQRSNGPFDISADPRRDFGRVPTVATVARARGAELPLWITEVGWNADPVDGSVTEAKQAEHVVGAVHRTLTEWQPMVERIFVYSWGQDGWGLRRADGSGKPAWTALSDYVTALRR